MQIIIDIPKEQYSLIMQWHRNGVERFISKETMMYAIANGIQLPKVHGRLLILSENRLKENQINLGWSCQKWINEVGLSNATVKIIEADTESE